MGKIVVTVELTENNYSGFIDILPGCVSVADTFDELQQEMREAVGFHLKGMREDGGDIPAQFAGDYELVYKFDAESLLSHYNGIFTNAALEKLTGINQKQLQRYASGKNKPRPAQTRKIAQALHRLGKELTTVDL